MESSYATKSESTTTTPNVSANQLGNELGLLRDHTLQASRWAEERFRLLGNLNSVTITIGVAALVQSTVSLTFNRSKS